MTVKELEEWLKKVLKDKNIPIWVKSGILELRKHYGTNNSNDKRKAKAS